jgi:hypothetical protein
VRPRKSAQASFGCRTVSPAGGANGPGGGVCARAACIEKIAATNAASKRILYRFIRIVDFSGE